MKDDKTLQQILIDTLNSNGFVEILAQQIAQQYGERLMDDFGNQITAKLAKYVDGTAQQYIEDYVVKANIAQRVSAVFRSIDRTELLEALRAN